MSKILFSIFQSVKPNLLATTSQNLAPVRNAAKKATSTTKNKGNNGVRPKHRGWRVQDGHNVQAGTILATQLKLRFHPGLNVGLGKNGTLFAMEAGRVLVTCEEVDLNWDHTWIQRHYSGREGDRIFKKHFNVLPEKQHNRFKLVDAI